MSTETEETTTELPDNLIKLPSGELHERAEALAVEADSALSADRWDDYKSAAENERKLRSEIERRGAAARKITPAEEAKIPVAAMDRIEQTRQALAEAEKAMEEFKGVKSRGSVAPEWGVSAEDADEPVNQKARSIMDVSKLAADLAAMEQRIPFLDYSDEQVTTEFEDTAIAMEDLRRDLKTQTDEGRRAAAAKTERLLAETTEKHYALMREDGVRSSERKKEAILDQLAERKALLHRETALKDWTRRKEELEAELTRDLRAGESPHFNMEPLSEAVQAVENITKMLAENQPLHPTELATQRALLEPTAPPVRGSFR